MYFCVSAKSKSVHPPPQGKPRAFDARIAPYSEGFDTKGRPPGRVFDYRRNVGRQAQAKGFQAT